MRHITIDLDPTHDATHGGQQLSFFNWHYDSWCYLPLAAFLSFDNEPDQYLFCCVLRAGNAHLMTVELATTLCDHAVGNFAINRHAH